MNINYEWQINKVFLETQGSTEPTIDVVTETITEKLAEDDVQQIEQQKTVITEGKTAELEKFVQSIDMTLIGTSDNGRSSSYDITAQLYWNPEGNYKNFDDITTEDLITWGENSLGSGVIDNLKSQISSEIEFAPTGKSVAWN